MVEEFDKEIEKTAREVASGRPLSPGHEETLKKELKEYCPKCRRNDYCPLHSAMVKRWPEQDSK